MRNECSNCILIKKRFESDEKGNLNVVYNKGTLRMKTTMLANGLSKDRKSFKFCQKKFLPKIAKIRIQFFMDSTFEIKAKKRLY